MKSTDTHKLLAADIGGTKTLLCLCEKQRAKPFNVLLEQRYASADYESFESMLDAFLRQTEDKVNIDAACIGVAGPVRDGRAQVTNLPWHLDAQQIAPACGIRQVQLINDFQAVGYGTTVLSDNEVVVLQSGEPHKQGVIAVLGAGTGLGEAFLIWSDGHYKVQATEGGHASFAPNNSLQIELLEFLLTRYETVSYDRVLCGLGLENLYHFFTEIKGLRASEAMRAYIDGHGIAPAITHFALKDTDAVAEAVLDLFVEIYGSQAANLALTTYATGGVYIAGGIAPRIISKIEDGGFLNAFLNKGRMRPLLEKMPVKVITNPKVGLLGAMVAADLIANGGAL